MDRDTPIGVPIFKKILLSSGDINKKSHTAFPAVWLNVQH